MLEIKDASLSVNGRPLLTGFSMIAMEGQMTCVTGPSGSGKTLLARVLLGFLPLDSGLVSLDGSLLTPLSVKTFRRRMAYLPQAQPPAVATFPSADEQLLGLDCVWSPSYEPDMAMPDVPDLRFQLPPMASRPVIIADDPDASFLSSLRTLANDGHTVVVMSVHDEFINMSDKLVKLSQS